MALTLSPTPQTGVTPVMNPAHRTTGDRISVALATNAVIAAYIYEISTRDRAGDEDGHLGAQAERGERSLVGC
jgi:hypothetical protein